MLVVSNTSPLIALAKINQFVIFQKLFQTVLIPQTVSDEFRIFSFILYKIKLLVTYV